jgi:hypothetical protein
MILLMSLPCLTNVTFDHSNVRSCYRQFQTPIRFPAVKPRLILVKEAEKKHLPDWARYQKAIGDIYFTKKWRAETLQPGLEFDNFKPRLTSSIFKSISWRKGSFLGDNDQSFLKEGVRTYQMAPMPPASFCHLSPTVYIRAEIIWIDWIISIGLLWSY